MTGDRGKKAEALVHKKLKALALSDCAYYRYPDARAGSFVPAPCDYMFCKQGRLKLLEVKEVNHSYRLPHGNFGPDQVARMRAWAAAGAEAWVLVYFTPEKLWRYDSIERFLLREGGSWDFRLLPLQDLEAIFKEIT